MLSESAFMIVHLLPLEFRLSLNSFQTRVRPVRVITRSIIFVFLFKNIYESIFKLQPSISGFVLYVLNVSFYFIMIAFLITVVCYKEDTETVYQRLPEIDLKLNKPISQERDVMLLVITLLNTLIAGSLLSLIYARGMKVVDVTYGAQVVMAFELMTLAGVKNAIAKRLRYIRSAEEYTDRVEDTISLTRQLLRCNTTLNTTYGLLATTFTVFVYLRFLYFCYSVWAIYGRGLDLPTASAIHLVPGFVSAFTVFLTLAVSGHMSSLIRDEIDEVILELDISLTARAVSKEQAKHVCLFLMELHYTPIELSALGLFDVSRATFSTACTTIISFLLVLVQFT